MRKTKLVFNLPKTFKAKSIISGVLTYELNNNVKKAELTYNRFVSLLV